MQWGASDSSLFSPGGQAPGSIPKKTASFGRSSASEAVSEQSALRQSFACGAPWMPARTFASVCVTSP